MRKDSPGAVASALLQERQGVRPCYVEIQEVGSGSRMAQSDDRSQLIEQTALAQRVGTRSVSGADPPRPH